MSKREASPLRSPAELFGIMSDHFNGLLDQNLMELYGVANPEDLAGRSLSTFEVAEGDAAVGSLMKVWFVGHARGQIRTASKRNAVTGSEAAQTMILSSHTRLGVLDVPKLFKIVPGAPDRNPHRQMLSHLRTATGGAVETPRGGKHVAEIFTGAVVLTEPDYKAIHPDPVIRAEAAALIR